MFLKHNFQFIFIPENFILACCECHKITSIRPHINNDLQSCDQFDLDLKE